MPRVCLVVLLALTSCRTSEVDPPQGDVASSLALPTLDGAAFDPTTLRGRPAIVLFWRIGCSYCMNELPVVSDVARQHGVAAIAVLVAGDPKRAPDAAKAFDGPVLVDDGSLRSRYNITAVPYTIVLRGDGTAARAYLGEQSASAIADALGGIY